MPRNGKDRYLKKLGLRKIFKNYERHQNSTCHNCVDVFLTTVQGNEMANLGEYATAIDLFTDAIKLNPKDFR